MPESNSHPLNSPRSFKLELGSVAVGLSLNSLVMWIFNQATAILFNPLCQELTGIGLVALFLTPIMLLLLSLCRINGTNIVNPQWRQYLKYLSIVGIILSLTYFILSDSKYTTGNRSKILVAKFDEGFDVNKIQESIYETLEEAKKKLPELSIDSQGLRSMISENDSENTTAQCLNDCNGSALIWGRYSPSEANGELTIHINFAKNCMDSWIAEFYKTITFKITDPHLKLKTREHVMASLKYLKVFSPLILNRSSCSPSKIAPELLHEAEAYISSLDTKEPGMLKSGYALISSYYFKQKEFSSADSILSQAIQKFPSDSQFLSLKTQCSESLGDYASANATLADALKNYPEDENLKLTKLILDVKSLARETKGNREPAYPEADLGEKLIAYGKDIAEKKNSKAYLDRSLVYMKIGMLKASEKDLDQYLKENPNQSDALIADCNLKSLKRDLNGAKIACKKAFDLNPKNPQLKQTIDQLRADEIPKPRQYQQ